MCKRLATIALLPAKGVKKVDKMALGKSDTIMAVAEPLRTFIVNDPTVSFV
ncbi:hypothetical protein lacNasYZ02_09200 [Lactobacillus nasalidis]|nr:hypothetical protein lacNasYZ01_08010 [Lactobacillus nasalidis]GHV99490.1 hypothetical protein lacNasYZ02_09200 [Lactobacillus nasalidis]